MLVDCEPEEFFKDDSGARDVEVVAEETFLVRDTDLLGKILEGLVRRTIEKSLPVLELESLMCATSCPRSILSRSHVFSIISLKGGNDRIRP